MLIKCHGRAQPYGTSGDAVMRTSKAVPKFGRAWFANRPDDSLSRSVGFTGG